MVDAHQNVPAGLDDRGDARWCAIATVPQQPITGRHRDTPAGFTTLGVADFGEIARQIFQVDAEVDAPVGAEAAGPADGGGIDGTNAVAMGQRRRGVTLPQLVGHPAQPLLRSAKPLKQGHRRDVTPTVLLGDSDRFLAGTATGQVDQQNANKTAAWGKPRVRTAHPGGTPALASQAAGADTPTSSHPVLEGVHWGSSP